SATLVGCDAVASDAPCEIAPGQEVRVLVDDRAAAASVVAVATYQSTCPALTVSPPSPSSVPLRLSLRGDEAAICVGTHGAPPVRLPLVPTRRPEWLREATRARRSGDTTTATALATAHQHDPGIDGVRATALRGRLALAR